jgi:hypothetical protein
MRQAHLGGDKLFVDYAGDTAVIIDRLTGKTRPAQIFVAVMGASNFTDAEASWTQALADWIGAGPCRAVIWIESLSPEIPHRRYCSSSTSAILSSVIGGCRWLSQIHRSAPSR